MSGPGRRGFTQARQHVLTLVSVVAGLWLLYDVLQWAFMDAVWSPTLALCEQAKGQGACWGVIAEKFRPLLWGRFPLHEQWRAAAASGLMIAATAQLLLRSQVRFKAVVMLLALGLSVWLMAGGLGLERVPSQRWGGLPLTLLVSLSALILAWPVALALAVTRYAKYPVLSALATALIELIRGVPLVAVLFVAAFVWPLLNPQSVGSDKLVRLILAITVFVAAYQAEIIRGGLQVVPRHQIEAARALGFGWWGVQRYIVLPQAIDTALPALVSSWISTLKDSSLITVVSVYELTGGLSIAIGGDVQWRAYYLEAYIFIALIYGLLCYLLATIGRQLERSGHHD